MAKGSFSATTSLEKKFGSQVFRDVNHRIIYLTKQFGDEVLGGYESGLLRFGFSSTYSG